MLAIRDEPMVVNSKAVYPSSTIWLFLTIEFFIGVVLSGFLAILAIVKSLLPKPPRDLTGDVVLIAGASSSLGESLAEEFATNGCSVICVDNDSKSIEETASRLKSRCSTVQEVTPRHRKDDSSRRKLTVSSYQCDLLNRKDIQRTAQRIKEDVGRIDVLVTCVGNPDQDIFDTASTTLMSHFWTVVTFLPLMLYRDRAHIVGVTPVASSNDAYRGSRAAIAGLMESLCHELSNHSSQLMFLTFSPTAECSTLKQSEELVARNIVEAVRTDQTTLTASWMSRFLYKISCVIYNGITRLTQWVHFQGCEYPA